MSHFLYDRSRGAFGKTKRPPWRKEWSLPISRPLDGPQTILHGRSVNLAMKSVAWDKAPPFKDDVAIRKKAV